MVNQSLFSQFGLLFGPKLEELGHETVGAALVMNVNSMVTNFSGLFTGPALKKYSTRTITLVGVLLTSIGMMLSSFATSLIHLIITYSFFTGLGLGLIMPGTFMAVNSYFTKRRGQAVGLAMAGTCVGQMLMPQVVRFLLDEFGYRGTTLILGAICLNGVVGALFFHPVKWHMIPIKEEPGAEKEIPLLTGGKVAIAVQLQDTTKEEANDKAEKVDKIEKVEKAEKELKPEESSKPQEDTKHEGFLARIVSLLDLDLLTDHVFLNITLGVGLVYACSVAFSMLFPFFLQDAGLTRSQTAMCMSFLAGTDVFARLTLPLLTRCMKISYRTTFLVGAIGIGLIRSFLATQNFYLVLLYGSGLCGYIRAATVMNQNLVISEYCTDQKKLPAALGLNMVTKGLLVLSVGQAFGWVRDNYESYGICIHSQTLVLLLVALMWTAEIGVNKLVARTKR